MHSVPKQDLPTDDGGANTPGTLGNILADGTGVSWINMLKLQAASTKNTYDKATYEKAVIPEAQMK